MLLLSLTTTLHKYFLHGQFSSRVQDTRTAEPLLITWLTGQSFGSASQQLTEHLRDEYVWQAHNVRHFIAAGKSNANALSSSARPSNDTFAQQPRRSIHQRQAVWGMD